MTIIYEPREDSTLLAKWVKQYATGKVLDVGTGSGIQAVTAAKKKGVTSVIAVDIQSGVISHCKNTIENKKIRFRQSDLFSVFEKGHQKIPIEKSHLKKQKKYPKFDTIIFNPPYLPEDVKVKDLTVEGGKKGYEVLERFFYAVNNYLSSQGIILIVFSSLTHIDKVNEFIGNNLLEFKPLESTHISFEDLYVYKIEKSELLRQLEKKGVSDLHYFMKGHRGLIFRGKYKNKIIMVKSKNPKSTAVGRLGNEIKWLTILNKKGIGPRLLFSDEHYFVYEYVPGPFIRDFVVRERKKSVIKKILKDVFEQMYTLDLLKVDKEEMHHPHKHVIITPIGKPVLLDFERCRSVEYPKNVTQFCQYINSLAIALRDKGFKIDKNKIIKAARKYKRSYSKKDFEMIKKLVQ